MTKMEELRKMKADYDAALSAKGKEAVSEQIAALFAANPTLTAVRWHQYTPYFNDGDPCTFCLGECYYKAAGVEVDDDDTDYGDGFESVPWRCETPLGTALNDFSRARDKDAYLLAFGDHVRVTATRDGVEVEEFEHD